MTLIVYRDGVLVSDRYVVTQKHLPKNFSCNLEKEEDKIIVTEDKQFAYVFNNDQIPKVIEAILIRVRRFELNLIKDDEPELKFKDHFKLVLMTKRFAYSIINDNDGLLFRIMSKDIYISPEGSYRHYEALTLTAEEVFEVMRVQDQYMIGTDYTVVKQSSLKLIKKEKK